MVYRRYHTTRMSLLLFSNELPSDDHHAIARRLRIAQKSSKHPYLAEFLRKSTDAVRDEIRLLAHNERCDISHLESILDIWNHANLRKGHLGGAIEGAMLLVLELGTLIGYVV